MAAKIAAATAGSSPLTRGTLTEYLSKWPASRFIPAYAGNSKSRPGRTHSITVHPRLRGELTIRISMVICTSGSSPLTRGTLNDSPYKALTRTVHPRLRGELFIVGVNVKSRVGSSPLTRGTRRDEYPVLGHLRFIPAYAGNSLLGFYRRSGRTVHPRLRGELLSVQRYRNGHFGSSPLTRGTHLKWLQHYTNRLTAKLLKNIFKQE